MNEMKKPSLTDEQMEWVEEHLLDAMKAIDKATAIIWETTEFLSDADQLVNAKIEIKKVLNRRYDACARRRMG